MEWKTKMAKAPAKWILSEFHGIPTFQSESSRFHRNSWGRVKTSDCFTQKNVVTKGKILLIHCQIRCDEVMAGTVTYVWPNKYIATLYVCDTFQG